MMNGLRFSIFMADDDEDDRMIMDEAFRQIGYESEVKKFATGEDLLRCLDQIDPASYPSLIVLDNTLPTLGAADVLKILKNQDQYREIPVVIYTSSVMPQKKQNLLQLGAKACVEKKNSMTDLVALARAFRNIAEKGGDSYLDASLR